MAELQLWKTTKIGKTLIFEGTKSEAIEYIKSNIALPVEITERTKLYQLADLLKDEYQIYNNGRFISANRKDYEWTSGSDPRKHRIKSKDYER